MTSAQTADFSPFPHKGGTLRRAANILAALRRAKGGTAAVEFALAAPVLLGLLVPVADLGIAYSEKKSDSTGGTGRCAIRRIPPLEHEFPNRYRQCRASGKQPARGCRNSGADPAVWLPKRQRGHGGELHEHLLDRGERGLLRGS
jgi:hypothetical protein